MKNAGPVTIREKKLQDGRLSLYLDIYTKGKRTYEFLKLYLVPAKTKQERDQNKQTRQLAEAIKAKRIVEIQNEEYGFKSKSNKTLLDCFDEHLNSNRENFTHNTYLSWITCRSNLIKSGLSTTNISNVTPDTINDFIDYLKQQGVTANSIKIYVSKIKAALRKVCEEGTIKHTVLTSANQIKTTQAERMYLTLDELKRLTATPCKFESLKRAFLFSCLTGLRKSDIIKLKWADVVKQGDLTRLIFRQKKTKSQEYLDITPNAERYLGNRGNDDTNVFVFNFSEQCINRHLKAWTQAAGITKCITFHCARHTFATLMLSLDVDIYTVSKLLGHADIATTQIYAKVLDKNKQEAVKRIPDIE
ncbi:MAG: tyrosine-type recombinase/integrase [Bacteroidales bacterium]|nr:tyrosine-type recombinase/integrase [Bacteroidales bacterium]